MDMRDTTVFITGANRGLGLAFARAALARGARKVYASARDPSKVTLAGVVPVKLDVTHPEDAAAAALACGDVTLLVNNAGIASTGGFLREESVDEARRLFETNFFGMLHVSRAFAPVLARNGGGAIVNVLSVSTWISGALSVYGASKSAAWALTNGLRLELAERGTQVLALHAGFIDTDLTQGIDGPKSSPDDIVRATLDGLEAGASEVLADDISRAVHAGLTASPPMYLHPRQ